MNTLETCSIVNPAGKTDECAKFVITDAFYSFVLHDISTKDQRYTFSCWVKSESAGMLTVGWTAFPTSDAWTKYSVSFIADSADVDISFDTAGTYYIYHPQLEIGTLATDWTPAPEDIVTTLAENYYDRTQTDAAINVSANAITSTVRAIKIGGRNLLTNTGGSEAITIIGGEMSCTSVPSWTNDAGLLTLNCSGRGSEIYYRFMAPSNSTDNLYNLEAGKTYTLSGKAQVSTASGTLTSLDVRTQCNAPGKGWAGGIRSVITTTDTTDWVDFVSTFTIEEDATGYYISLQLYYVDSWDGTIQVKDLMLEQGNKASEWSPAPEDVANSIGTAQNTANDAADRIIVAESQIKQLADSIASLVRGESGGTLVKQDENGLWYFDISTIEENVSQTANDLDEVEGLVRDAEGKIDVLNSLAEALAAKTEYIRQYTDENDQPCLELGEGDSSFKLRITNTQIQFLDGTSVPAYVSNRRLMIERAEVTDELMFGDFVWKKRESGSMGIMWAGGENLLVNTHRFMAGTPIVMTSSSVDHHKDVFDNYILYTPVPVPAGSKVWVQACSDAIWAAEHMPSSASPQTVGLFVYWCKTLAEAMREDTDTANHYTHAYFFHGDNLTFGRRVGQVNVPAVSGSTTEWYARIRLNLYPNGTDEVTHKFWNIKMEVGEKAGVWTPHANDESIW